MFIFGHIGIGRKIASPWARGLEITPLVLGTLLPDLIDKPIFYIFRALNFTAGLEVVGGTRAFGHTALLLLLILAISRIRESRFLVTVALGMATHLLLDNLADHLHGVFTGQTLGYTHSAAIALLWPFLGVKFAPFPFASAADHLKNSLQPEILICEVLGLLFIGWDAWKAHRKGELTKILFSRRYRMMRRKNWGQN